MLVATDGRKRENAPLVTSGVYLAMVKCTGPDVAAAPMSSETTAVSVCKPSAKANWPVVKRYGLLVILRSKTAPSKDATFVILPCVSLASAPIVMLSVLPKTELAGGLVIVTLSAGFVALTKIFTTLDVVERPPLSVATEVSAWLPAAKVTAML